MLLRHPQDRYDQAEKLDVAMDRALCPATTARDDQDLNQQVESHPLTDPTWSLSERH